MSKTVIIGGVAGGATAAARLRRLDENMEIVMLERGKYISLCQLRPAVLYRRRNQKQRVAVGADAPGDAVQV